MNLSVLNVIKSFCYEANIPPPVTLSAATDPGTLQLIALFLAVCRELRQAKIWDLLKKSYTFNTVAATSAYALPTDFYSAIIDSGYNSTNKWSLGGPISDGDFDGYTFGYSGPSAITKYRIFGMPGVNQFQITPTPGGVITLNFDYISKNFLGTGATPYTWSENIVTDADVCVFDDELLIQGLKYKWYQMKGLDYESIKSEFDAKVDQAVNRFKGSFRGSFNRYGTWRGPRPSTPGGWSY